MAKLIVSSLIAKKLNLSKNDYIVEGKNLSEIIYNMNSFTDGFSESILDSNNKINPFIAVALNNEIVNKDKLSDIVINENDEIIFTNMIAGG